MNGESISGEPAKTTYGEEVADYLLIIRMSPGRPA